LLDSGRNLEYSGKGFDTMVRPAVSLEQLQALLTVLEGARDLYGAEAVARVESAFLGDPQPAPDDQQEPQPACLRLPGLTAHPWHDPAAYKACRILEENAAVIHGELQGALNLREGFQTFRQDRDYFIPEEWKSLYILIGAKPVPENHLLCPETTRIIQSIPNTFGLAMFSALLPGGHIRPHRGPSNCRITIHLGLIVPPGCALRVGPEKRAWTPGHCLVFDDTFEHEAWNRSAQTRFVLLLDVWHPDLTHVEIAVLAQAQRILEQADSTQSVSRILSERDRDEATLGGLEISSPLPSPKKSSTITASPSANSLIVDPLPQGDAQNAQSERGEDHRLGPVDGAPAFHHFRRVP
jgi:aspartate beta-hydroxylase